MRFHHPWWHHSHRLFSPFLLVILSGSKGKTPKKEHCPEETKEHFDRRWSGESHEWLYRFNQEKKKGKKKKKHSQIVLLSMYTKFCETETLYSKDRGQLVTTVQSHKYTGLSLQNEREKKKSPFVRGILSWWTANFFQIKHALRN